MFVLAGLTRDVPRADELFYVALLKHASRNTPRRACPTHGLLVTGST